MKDFINYCEYLENGNQRVTIEIEILLPSSNNIKTVLEINGMPHMRKVSQQDSFKYDIVNYKDNVYLEDFWLCLYIKGMTESINHYKFIMKEHDIITQKTKTDDLLNKSFWDRLMNFNYDKELDNIVYLSYDIPKTITLDDNDTRFIELFEAFAKVSSLE